jgi:hypothetical protein
LWGVIESFLSLLTRHEKRSHNMLDLMLKFRFKSLKFISYFIRHEQGVTIAKEFDRRSLFFMFLTSYHHLHPLF